MAEKPMPIKKVLDALFEGPCDLPTLHERTGIDGKDLQRMVQTLAEMKNCSCERHNGKIIWSLTDEMEESMHAREGDERIEGEESEQEEHTTRPHFRRGAIGKRKAGEIIVSAFVPAQPEVSIYRDGECIVIKCSPDSGKVSIPRAAAKLLSEKLEELAA